MQIDIDRTETRVLLELVRRAETDAGGPLGRGTANSDINVVYLGVLHGIVVKLDDVQRGASA